MALLARERMRRTGEATTFRGWDLRQVDYTVRDFVCKALLQRVRHAPVHDRGREDLLGRQVLRPLPQARQGRQGAGDRRPRRPARASCCSAPYEAARASALGGGAHRRHPAGHVHLRPPAVLGDLLRRAGPAPGAVAGERQADPRGGRRHHRRRAVLPDQRRPRPRRSGCSSRASTGSSCPTRSTRRPSSRSTTRTPAPGARRCRSSCARRRGSSATATSSSTPRVRFRDGREPGSMRDLRQMAAAAGRQQGGSCATPLDARPTRRRTRSATPSLAAGREALATLESVGRARHRRSSAGRTTCTTRASTWTSRASCASSTA